MIKKIVVPKGSLNLVISCLLLVVSCSCFAQLADQLPDTLSKKKICGSYISAQSGSLSKIKIKRNHSFIWTEKAKHIDKTPLTGKWEIKNDTLFLTENNESQRKKKFVMHNDKIYFVNNKNAVNTQGWMTKKDYKFYQRQCRQSGK